MSRAKAVRRLSVATLPPDTGPADMAAGWLEDISKEDKLDVNLWSDDDFSGELVVDYDFKWNPQRLLPVGAFVTCVVEVDLASWPDLGVLGLDYNRTFEVTLWPDRDDNFKPPAKLIKTLVHRPVPFTSWQMSAIFEMLLEWLVPTTMELRVRLDFYAYSKKPRQNLVTARVSAVLTDRDVELKTSSSVKLL